MTTKRSEFPSGAVNFLETAVLNNGLVEIESDLIADRDKKRNIGKPLTTTKKRVDMLSTIFEHYVNFPFFVAVATLGGSDRSFSKKERQYLANCFVFNDGKYYLDFFNILSMQDRNLDHLIEMKEFFVFMKSMILKNTSDKIYFQFYKQRNPVRLKPDFLNKQKIDTVDQVDVDHFYKLASTPVIKDWLLSVVRTPFYRHGVHCWMTVTDKALLNPEEQYALYNILYPIEKKNISTGK